MDGDGKAQARSALERARAALLEDARKSTSAQDHKAARWLIVLSLPLDSPLRRRMQRCGRRSADTDQRYDCDLPACPVCAGRRGDRYFKRTMWPALEHVPMQQLRWVTIVTHLATHLADGVRQMAAHHRSLKHIIAKLGTGQGLRVFGAREVDVYRTSDWSGLSPAKRDLLTALNWPSDHRGPVFAFHLHMVIDLGRVSSDNLGAALRVRWAGVRRVHVMGLNARRKLEINLRNLACYPVKARMTREVGEDRRAWLDAAEITQLVTWMCSIGVRWFRFSFGVRGDSRKR
jgi:hypothetical protein